MARQYWLMKAEPDSRVLKGQDVKFSVDDFESVKTTPWEGVRNAEARNLMKEMKIGDNVLFYHSNCKSPGIAGFAKVTKEAYHDHTAWDPEHPYYDPKTDPEKPKWFMVDLTFTSRATNFVPLSILRHIADDPSDNPPDDVEYIGEAGVKAIKGMVLVRKSRLSVQRVEEEAWGVIEKMAEKGGWDEAALKRAKGKAKRNEKSASGSLNKKNRVKRTGKKMVEAEEEIEMHAEGVEESSEAEEVEMKVPAPKKRGRDSEKGKGTSNGEKSLTDEEDGDNSNLRQSKRGRWNL